MQQSRRDFIKESAASVTGLTGGLSLLALLEGCKGSKKGKKVKLLSPNGEVVEVDEDSIVRTIPEMTLSAQYGKRFAARLCYRLSLRGNIFWR